MQSLFEEGARLRQATNDLLTLLPQLEANQLRGVQPGDEDDLDSVTGGMTTRESSVRVDRDGDGDRRSGDRGTRRRNNYAREKVGEED